MLPVVAWSTWESPRASLTYVVVCPPLVLDRRLPSPSYANVAWLLPLRVISVRRAAVSQA
ncbi:MAG TPA: hypothetical protein VFH48_02145 [Chloroflexota bacterium]|nr:hypothetical protein [Chloroflexota bacterium]